ncbi:DUF1415 domain-containing protein [Thalassotalea fusca]
MQQPLTPKQQTQAWLKDIIVDLNFCPFAKRELVNDTIEYCVSTQRQIKNALEEIALQCHYLTNHPEIETTLIVYSDGFKRFEAYLDLVDYANDLLAELSLEGVYQIASFHPDYCFEGEAFDDPANYTNRSPFPMIHLLREKSIERALSQYPSPELIPERNIDLARKKGTDFFVAFLARIKS